MPVHLIDSNVDMCYLQLNMWLLTFESHSSEQELIRRLANTCEDIFKDAETYSCVC